MLLFKILFASFLMFGFGETLEENLRCIVGDAECEKTMYNHVLEKYAGGVPEAGLLPADPMELKDISVSILGAINLTLINAVGRGVRMCKLVELTSFIAKTDLLKIHKVCNITVDGRFRISSSDPVILEKLGLKSLDKEGNGTLEFNDFNIFLNFPYTFSRHDDGEIYMKSYFNDIKYTIYEFKEIKFTANELFIDSQEANNFIVKFLNENSNFMIPTIGRDIVNKVMQFYHTFCEKFIPTLPAKLLFKGDLAPLLTD